MWRATCTTAGPPDPVGETTAVGTGAAVVTPAEIGIAVTGGIGVAVATTAEAQARGPLDWPAALNPIPSVSCITPYPPGGLASGTSGAWNCGPVLSSQAMAFSRTAGTLGTPSSP